MGQGDIVGDWSEVRLRVHIDPSGVWTIDVERSERYVAGRPRFPIASGSVNRPITVAALDAIEQLVRMHCAWAIDRAVMPF